MIDDAQALPHSLEAERAVIGAVLLQNANLQGLVDTLQATHFYRAAHRHIWTALVALDAQRLPMDLLTLTEQLGRQGVLEEVGVAYAASLVDGVPVSTNAPYYAAIVVEKATLRELIAICSKVRAAAFTGEETAADLIGECERLLLGAAQQRASEGLIDAERWMSETSSTVMALAEARQMVTGVPTGFHDLDHMTRGLQAGDLVIVAGRPSMGKTSLVLQLGLTAAASGAVAFFSLEMSRQALGLRTAALMAQLPAQRILAGRLFADDFDRLSAGLDQVAGTQFWIDDTPHLTPEQIRSRARRLALSHPLRLIAIDYLQLMQGDPKVQSREQQVAGISRMLKAIARELQVPLVVLAQLNRANETRADKRPQLSDLRESGALEQDADLVLLIHRPEYYEQTPTHPGLAEVIVAKQRNGPTGTVQLRFHGPQTRFAAWEESAA